MCRHRSHSHRLHPMVSMITYIVPLVFKVRLLGAAAGTRHNMLMMMIMHHVHELAYLVCTFAVFQ